MTVFLLCLLAESSFTRMPPHLIHDQDDIASRKMELCKTKPSCKKSCGEGPNDGAPQPPPCSCDFRCMVYGDCCPDFELECPEEVLVLSNSYFSRLLKSQVGCVDDDSGEKFAVVTGCPRRMSTPLAGIDDNYSDDSLRSFSDISAPDDVSTKSNMKEAF